MTLINNSLEYDYKFKEQFSYIDVNLETYIVDDLCTQYLNNVETDFQLENITPLFNMLNNTNNITGFITENNIIIPIPNMNNSKNTSTTEVVIFSSLISFICGVLVTALYFINNRQKIDYSDTDADGVDGNDAALQEQLVKKQTLNSNNFEEFFKVELSRMKELAQSGEKIKNKFLPKILRKEMENFVNSDEYTQHLKNKLTVLLQESHDAAKAFNKTQANYIKYIDKIVAIMKVTIESSSNDSVDNTTNNSNTTGARFSSINTTRSDTYNTADGAPNLGVDNEETPLLGSSEATDQV